MAFCKYCGKQLSDGETCSCNAVQQENSSTDYADVKNEVNGDSYYQQPPVQQYQQPMQQYQQGRGIYGQQPYYIPQVQRQTVSKFSVFINVIKGYFKSPSKTKSTAVQNVDIPSALISLAVYVISLIISLFSYEGAIRIKTGMDINVGLTFLFAILFGVIFFGIQFLSILFYSLYSGKRGVSKSIFIYCAVGKIFPSMLIIVIGLISLISPILGAILFIIPAAIIIIDTFKAQIVFGKVPESFADYSMLVFLVSLGLLLTVVFVIVLLSILLAHNAISTLSSFNPEDLIGGLFNDIY